MKMDLIFESQNPKDFTIVNHTMNALDMYYTYLLDLQKKFVEEKDEVNIIHITSLININSAIRSKFESFYQQ